MMLLNDTAHSGNSITRFFESICKPGKAGDSGFVKKKKKKKKKKKLFQYMTEIIYIRLNLKKKSWF